MTYIPGINQPIPGSPSYQSAASTPLETSQYPMVYTTDGPLPASNGIAFVNNGMIFDPNLVAEGTLDCGVFGSQA